MLGVRSVDMMSSTIVTLGESYSDTASTLTAVFKPLSTGPDLPLQAVKPKNKVDPKESINQRCDLMLTEQILHLQEIQTTLGDTLDIMEHGRVEGQDVAQWTDMVNSLYSQAEHGAVLVSVIGKLQNELFHTRHDLQKLISSSDREVLARVQERTRWLENRIERVLVLHRQSVLDAKRAKASSTNSTRSLETAGSETSKEKNKETLEDRSVNVVKLGTLPFKEDTTEDTTVSVVSHKSKATTTTTITTITTTSTKATTSTRVTTTKSEEMSDSLWSGKKSGHQPLWHTLPLIPRSPIHVSCLPFDRSVPWLDRKGSSYDLLCFQKDEFNQLMDKVEKVYEHIQVVADNAHEVNLAARSPTNVSSRMSRLADGKSDYDCYGLEPPLPLKWGRLSRNAANIYPRSTSVWHKGAYLAPVRRIANQQQQTQSRQPTPATSTKSINRNRMNRAKTKIMLSVSLQKLNKSIQNSKKADTVQSGLELAKRARLEFLITNSLQSDIAKIRKEGARDLGILYKSHPSYSVINALKSLVYMDDNIFVLIEASKALLKIGVWDTAALEVLIQAIKYGSDELRGTLLEMLRKSTNPHLLNKQSVQFRVLHALLLDLIKKQNPKLSSLAALVCAYFDIRDDVARETLMYYLKHGHEDLQSWALEALTKNLDCHCESVIKSCLTQMRKAIKWENRAAAARIIVSYKSAIEEYSLSQDVFEELQTQLYDDASWEVRQAVAYAINNLGLHNKTLQLVVRKLDDLNEDVRAQGVMSLSILGIKGKSLLNQLLDILELDSSIYVRIQVMRAVRELNIMDKRVLRLLRERARGTGPMCGEAQLSLFSLTGETV